MLSDEKSNHSVQAECNSVKGNKGRKENELTKKYQKLKKLQKNMQRAREAAILAKSEIQKVERLLKDQTRKQTDIEAKRESILRQKREQLLNRIN